jgi:hypothetical protein
MADPQKPQSRLYKTERTSLTRDDREARVQDEGTKLYRLPPTSTPSLTGMRRTLPSRALTGQVALADTSRPTKTLTGSRTLRGGRR